MAATEPDYLESGSEAGAARIYDNIQASMPGVILPTIQMELWNTIEEFCLRSTYYRALVPFALGPGQQSVDLNPYASAMVIFAVLWVQGIPYYTVQPPAVLIDTDIDINGQRHGTALCALKPVSFGACLPSDLWSRWFECMMDGVKARLMAHPAKPYSNPTMGEYHARRFRVGISLARAEAQQLYSGQTNFRYPYFARGKRKQ